MNRPPKKTIAAALGGIFLALSASVTHAAGLGKLSVSSALGQPLAAEIELVSLQPGEFESIAARVASPEAYTDARVEYSPLLRQLRFSIERKADGKPILKIVSNTPINEPFLDVLVEMSWPSGRLLREYPILLDPPGFSEAKIQVPTAAVTPQRPAAPVTATPLVPTPPVAAVSTPRVDTPKSDKSDKGDTYGPVKRGDTLAKIASEMKPDSVSLDQMLVALFRENKSAFVNNNMNLLKTGQVLRIPSATDVANISKGDASKEVRVQVADWKSYREQIAGTVAATPAKPAPTNEAAGKIATVTPVAPPPVAPSDQLKIAKADTTGKTGATGAKGVVDAAKEDAIAKQKAMAEANARIAELEKQKADAKKIADLKAATPAVPVKPETKVDTKVAQVTPTPAPAVPAPAPTPAPVPAAPVVATPPVATPPATAPVNTTAVAPTPAAPVTVPVAPPTGATNVPTEVKPVVPKPPVKVVPAPTAKEPELMDTVIDNLPVIAGIGGAGVLGIGGLLFMRRRKKDATSGVMTTQTSSLMPSDLKPNTVTGNKAGGLVDTGNSSFLTDFDKTGPGAIDTDEVDPVAEAEVYIAYGRDAQAEEILKEAIARDKSRHEISMKLLEIYHARKSAPAFETVARGLKESVGADSPVWAKAAAMGASIDPANALYSGAANADATGTFVAGGAAMAAGAAALASAEAQKPDLDFDLGFDDAATTKLAAPAIDITSPSTDQPAMGAGGGLDFDLDLNAAPAAVASHDAGLLATDASAAAHGLDFDLGMDTPTPAPSLMASAMPVQASDNFDFDLSALSLDEPADHEKTQKISAPAAPAASIFADTIKTTTSSTAPTLSLSDLSLDLDEPSHAPAAPSGGDNSSAAATKLELAKAYIEIGDGDGAKEILHEVSREGSAAQQAEAKAILAGL